MRRRMRQTLLALGATGFVVAAGCGGTFELPTENRAGRGVPPDQSYAMLATWSAMNGIQDLLLTQGQGNQLFLLFNYGGTGGPTTPRGEVKLYPLSRPEPIGPPYFVPMSHLFNPIALSSAQSKLFVLDQGDSCMAKYDQNRGTCEASSDSTNRIRNLTATWRVREYGLGGGDTVSTFTDTSFAQVYGVAADNRGFVYVSGIAVVLDTLVTDPRIRTRKFVSRVYRYARGPKYPGIPDPYMPGASWHRDTSWVVFDGTGNSSISDPRGIYWSQSSQTPLFIADRGNNQVKAVSVDQIGFSFVRVDGQETGANFNQPWSVTADLAGFFYLVDRDNRRVLRYDLAGNYIQRVDFEPNADGQLLADPTSVAVDDSLAYIADRGRGQVIRYRRRQ